jgi:hypothetical protein
MNATAGESSSQVSEPFLDLVVISDEEKFQNAFVLAE